MLIVSSVYVYRKRMGGGGRHSVLGGPRSILIKVSESLFMSRFVAYYISCNISNAFIYTSPTMATSPKFYQHLV